MASLFDAIPNDILHLIAGNNMATYNALVHAYPRFARLITNGIRFDYAEKFGINYHVVRCVSKDVLWGGTWTLSGARHRVDGPAITWGDGDMWYYYYGKRHRIDGPALIAENGQLMEYYIYGELHREDGPARTHSDGRVDYYRNDKRHRGDGPAIIYANGRELYFIDGTQYDEKAYYRIYSRK